MAWAQDFVNDNKVAFTVTVMVIDVFMEIWNFQMATLIFSRRKILSAYENF